MYKRRYFLTSLVLVDGEDRKCFKQQVEPSSNERLTHLQSPPPVMQEITLYRLDDTDLPQDGVRRPLLSSSATVFAPAAGAASLQPAPAASPQPSEPVAA